MLTELLKRQLFNLIPNKDVTSVEIGYTLLEKYAKENGFNQSLTAPT